MKAGMKLIFLLCVGSALVSSSLALAGETKEMKCISIIDERIAASAARDWENLERIANNFLANCKGIHDSEFLSYGYEEIALANNELGKPKSALAAAESCIRTYYGNPACHAQKSSALIKLGKKKEAIKALDIADKVARHELERAEKNLDNSKHPYEKELFEAKKGAYEKTLELIKALHGYLAYME